MATVVRTSFGTSNAEEALPVLAPIYPRIDLSPSPQGTFRFDLDSVDSGLVSTVRYRLASPNSASVADGAGVLSIAHLLHGRMHLSDGREEVDMTKPFLAPARAFGGSWDDVTIGGVGLDLPEVERFARVLAGSDSFRLAFTGVNPVNDAATRFWTTTVSTINHTLRHDDDGLGSPLIRRAMFEQLALALLNVFPNTLMDLRDARDRTTAVPAAIRRAIAFIEDNLDREISVADIAEAARMSVRGLTGAFRRELDTTPLAHLRKARLAAAHLDLLAGDPSSGLTVTAVAHRWGFHNVGRFCAAHQEQFGTAPAVTLRS